MNSLATEPVSLLTLHHDFPHSSPSLLTVGKPRIFFHHERLANLRF